MAIEKGILIFDVEIRLSIFERSQYCKSVKDKIYTNLILYTKILNKNKFAFDKFKTQMDKLQEAMLDED